MNLERIAAAIAEFSVAMAKAQVDEGHSRKLAEALDLITPSEELRFLKMLTAHLETIAAREAKRDSNGLTKNDWGV